ncbi:hypothetical protein NKR23_g8316 [Pleurostoma richardsiae]|uniref:Uncharacterized protein n=1 Tax=Pleurostoma richardsiae TaxID=41990 RepID=A0AA38R6F8_9PEZI|nr:hypothetical protein NKR23_g8316 [Pleurostoma richardsiae]
MKPSTITLACLAGLATAAPIQLPAKAQALADAIQRAIEAIEQAIQAHGHGSTTVTTASSKSTSTLSSTMLKVSSILSTSSIIPTTSSLTTSNRVPAFTSITVSTTPMASSLSSASVTIAPSSSVIASFNTVVTSSAVSPSDTIAASSSVAASSAAAASSVAPAASTGLATAANRAVLDTSGSKTMTGTGGVAYVGKYAVYQNLWGASTGNGSQATTADGMAGSELVWHTSWSWAGNASSVKSYANAEVDFTPRQLSDLAGVPTTWSWAYAGDGLVANVAYDMFTGASAGGGEQYEVMVWLDAVGGAYPISTSKSVVATATIGGAAYDLYQGAHSGNTVYTFVAQSTMQDYSTDLLDFLTYLVDNQGLPSSQYLLSVGAGTEAFIGSNAVFTTSAYTCSVE